MKSKRNKNNSKVINQLLFSTEAISGKLLLTLSPIYYFFQIQGVDQAEYWYRIANISIAIFVLGIGVYILYNEYKRKDEYTQDQHSKIIEMAERSAELAEASTRAVENSTEAINNMSSTMERVLDKLNNID